MALRVDSPAPLRAALSIRRKLTLIVLVTSGVAVILASAIFLAYDYVAFREQMMRDLETTAEGVGLLVPTRRSQPTWPARARASRSASVLRADRRLAAGARARSRSR